MSVESPATTTSRLFDRHRETLDAAVAAIADRGYWTPYPEMPKAYGEEAAEQGRVAYAAHLGQRFELGQPGPDAWVGDERSPWGTTLGVSYQAADVDALVGAAQAALAGWRDAGVDARVGVALEALSRINRRSHEIALAVMHTTGQAFPMAFQAGGPHAQDRALEAVAYAYDAMRSVPRSALWEKPQGKRPPLRMRKRFTVTPRGVALVIGCNTFPTWNGYPGLFASLVTGNPVIVKPSSRAILPLAITVRVLREVLAEEGLDPNVVTLAVDAPGTRCAGELAARPEVKVIDYTGSTAFGEQLEQHAARAAVFTEKAGVNTVVIDSTDDYKGMLSNLAFTLSLYSGQMCTTTQNLLIPAGGIETDEGHRSFEDVGEDLAQAVDVLLGDPERAVGILGAIVNDDVLQRIDAASELGEVVLSSRAVDVQGETGAVVRTPALVAVDGPHAAAANIEQFGPITLLVPAADTGAALEAWAQSVRDHGAITAGIYSSDEDVLARAEQIALDVGVSLSCNLTQGVYVNQSAAYSDFHASGLNPAASASLSDPAFVAPRFHVVQSRRHEPAEAA